jgi:1D-myo-inositol 3-kinase
LTQIDFLVIGHVTTDITPRGYSLGGTVAYASITARNLGFQAGLLSRAGPDFQSGEILAGIETHILPSAHTTTFENIYTHGERTQFLHACAEPISERDVPARWRAAKIVLLGPIAQELDVTLAGGFPHALVGAVLQGWLRQWDTSGRVTNQPDRIRQLALDGCQVVFVSEEDIAGNGALLDWLRTRIPIVVLTTGKQGSTVCHAGQMHRVAPRPADEVDPTGAGDVFAAAYLLHLSETHDIVQAAQFANVVASFSVEAPGPAGIPRRHTVVEWMTRGAGAQFPAHGASHAR